ncbi:MAG: ABC transporter ATP-binding protein [Actinobacteria bacterium]|nr:ABC transporter ATP-binding protein [Actinomycetota bacterium]
MRKILVGISRKIEYSIRTDFFAHLQNLDSSFFINTRTGSTMALMTNDLEAVRSFLGPGLMNLFNTIFVFVTTLTVMFLINVKLSLYSLVAIPVLPFIISRLSAMLYSRFKKSQEQYSVLSARTQESIAGIKVIKSFAQEENERSIFSKLNLEYINRNLSLAKIRSVFWPSMIFIGGIGILVVLLVGGRQVIAETLTLGQFVQFSAYIGSITWPLISLGWVINLVQRGAVSMKRINNIFKIKPGITSPKRPAPSKPFKGDVSFSGIYFRHGLEKNTKILIMENFQDFKDTPTASKNSWVLEDINFDINAGMQVGIVGFTGSGKSTLVNLLPRLDDPQKGKIFLDGRNIRSYSLDHLRGSIGYVAQMPFLFSKTIRENILFGAEGTMDGLSEEAVLNRILRASSISHLHTDISGFPDSYETLIGERGVTLSGGQKQRLAIARALVAEPRILILDDSFSNVDTDTEESILKDLKTETRDITTIIISHRISTIKDSDLIMVLDEGKIDSAGKHGELMKKCGIYQSLYQRQQLSEELDEEL